MGWMLEMVTSSLGSSFSRAQEVVKEAVPPSVSHRDPKASPTVNGLSLYLEHPSRGLMSQRCQRHIMLQQTLLCNSVEADDHAEQHMAVLRGASRTWGVRR